MMYVEYRLNNGCVGLSQLWHEADDDSSCKYEITLFYYSQMNKSTEMF